MIKNIIFDFGNVLLNLDEELSYNKLNQLLSKEKLTDIEALAFHPFEKGLISEEAFFNRLQRRSSTVFPVREYIDAWNAMILDFPDERIEFVLNLRKQFKVFLLSNTNITHLRFVRNKIIKENHLLDFENALFDKAYFSHEIHLRKPEPEIFYHVLKDSHLTPKETVFIDDKLENVSAARSIGIHSLYLKNEMEVMDELPAFLKKISTL